MKQLIEDRYIGAKVGDTIGVVDRRGFIAPDEGGGKNTGVFFVKDSRVQHPSYWRNKIGGLE